MEYKIETNVKSILDWSNPNNVYIILALVRKKHSEKITRSSETVIRQVARSQEEFENLLHEMKIITRNHRTYKPDDFYLYTTFNPRHAEKAYKLLKKQIIEWDELIEPYKERVIKKVHKQWISLLQRPECKTESKYFLIDLDKPEYIEETIKSLEEENIKIEKVYKTKNGYHILVKPFDVRKFEKIKQENKNLYYHDGIWKLEMAKDRLLNIECERTKE